MDVIPDVPDLITFSCDGARDGKPCGAQYTGRPHDLRKLGWVGHDFASPGMRRNNATFLLCDECTRHFERIWKQRKAAA